MLLIDSNSLASRAYSVDGRDYAVFFNMAGKIIAETAQTNVIWVFDSAGKCFRHTLLPRYKEHRPPDGPRYAYINNLKTALLQEGFCVAEAPEGDDALAFLTQYYRQPWIFTSDSDLWVLSEQAQVLWCGKSFSNRKVIKPHHVLDRFGVPANLMPDYKGLAGDSADGIPGVTGVGHKGAVQLLRRYGNGEAIFNNPPKTGRYHKTLTRPEAVDEFRLSKRVGTLSPEHGKCVPVGDPTKTIFSGTIQRCNSIHKD